MNDVSALRALVLGTAAGGGLPQWNCGCPNCVLARDPASGLEAQTQSSLGITRNGADWAILNASPDIRQQIFDNPALHPKALRDSPIKSVLVTNGDIDHIAGLLILREKQRFNLFITPAIAGILAQNPIFRALDPDYVTTHTVALEQSFALLEGIEARLFAVPGKIPLFLEEGTPDTALMGEQTVGVEISANGRRVYYIPGCSTLNPALADRIRNADLVFFDGTVFHDDEMIRTGTGQKTGQRMGHMAMEGAQGSLAALSPLGIKRIVYVHINNTNPVWRHGPERLKVETAGFQIGYDGMEIAL